jgi:hypothetical protein
MGYSFGAMKAISIVKMNKRTLAEGYLCSAKK